MQKPFIPAYGRPPRPDLNQLVNPGDFDPICAICLLIMKKPTRLECGHSFCWECIASFEICPTCRRDISHHIFNEGIENKIKECEVYCPSLFDENDPEDSCPATMMYKDLASHTKTCQYISVLCQCKKKIQRRFFDNPEITCDCPDVQCTTCQKFFSRRVLGFHKIKCIAKVPEVRPPDSTKLQELVIQVRVSSEKETQNFFFKSTNTDIEAARKDLARNLEGQEGMSLITKLLSSRECR